MKILFISHDASRTGAPILLRNFIEKLKVNNSEIIFDILLRRGGILESDFAKLGKTYLFKPTTFEPRPGLIYRLINKLGFNKVFHGIYLWDLVKKLEKNQYDLVFSNTIVNVDVLEYLQKLKLPTITHVRELSWTIEHYGGQSLMAKLYNYTDFFIADSQAVKENLIARYNYQAQIIRVIPEFIPIPSNLPSSEIMGKIKKKLSIPEDAKVVGASGSGIWRKGPDVFLQVANQVVHKYGSNAYFLWLGHFPNEIKMKIDFDLEKMNLEKNILFPGSVQNPLDYYSILDVFLLTSREEPFGIVALEASLFEVPTICFEKIGGLPEYILTDAGIVVPYLNTYKMAEETIRILENPEIKNQLGSTAKKRTLQYHNIDYATENIIEIVKEVLA